MDLTTYSFITIPLGGHVNPIAIDYDPMGGRIYWTDVAAKQIRSASLDGADNETVRALSASELCSLRSSVFTTWMGDCFELGFAPPPLLHEISLLVM